MQVDKSLGGQVAKTLPLVLCCVCGVTMEANQANTCAQCLATHNDITDGFAKTGVLCRCKGCERYQRDTQGWLNCARESRELLAFCLKKIKGLKAVKLVDASFIWTEPHSKRIKVKLKVQKEVTNGVTLQQTCVVEFTEQNRMCEDCHRNEANLVWNSTVQVRQKVNHKRTFLFLEQLILKHNACDRAIKISPQPMGVDFFFSVVSDAVRFEDFLESVIPVRYNRSKKIVSMDIKSNIACYNHTFIVEIVPICKDDFMVLPIELARRFGNISQTVLCTQVSSSIRLIDVETCQMCEMTSEAFWQYPFRSIAQAKQLVEFVVLDVTPVEETYDSLPKNLKKTTKKRRRAQTSGVQTDHRMRSKKHSVCDVEVAKASDFNKRYVTRCHLGYILKPGDSVMGYDISSVIHNDSDSSGLRKGKELPEIVLVRKFFPKYRGKTRSRNWKLKSLAAEHPDQPGAGMGANMDNKDDERDMEIFMRDIEEDKELRSQLNLYKDAKAKRAVTEQGEDVEEDAPVVALDELLEDMNIEASEMDQGSDEEDDL